MRSGRIVERMDFAGDEQSCRAICTRDRILRQERWLKGAFRRDIQDRKRLRQHDAAMSTSVSTFICGLIARYSGVLLRPPSLIRWIGMDS
jgi:hypothetical protein